VREVKEPTASEKENEQDSLPRETVATSIGKQIYRWRRELLRGSHWRDNSLRLP